MQSKSLSHAKALLALCLLIVLTSVHFGRAWHLQVKSLTASLEKTHAEHAKSEKSLLSLASVLTPDLKTMPLDSAVSAVMLEVFNKRVEHGVAIASATPAKVGGGGMNQLSALAEDVPGSTLKSVKVNITGTYQTYPGLIEYLQNLQESPVAVIRLKVQDQSFEAAIRIFGVLDNK